jgi:preprotein translocase subunit SecY
MKAAAPALRLYSPATTVTVKVQDSEIPGVRSSIRKELKMLRSVSIAVILLGFLFEAILCICAETFTSAIGTLGALIAVIIGCIVGIIALFLAFVIRFSANEISDQLKKLNKEA